MSFNDHSNFWIWVKKLDEIIFDTPLLKSRSQKDLSVLLKKLCALQARGLLGKKKRKLEETLQLIITSKKHALFYYCGGAIIDEAKRDILRNRFKLAGNDGNKILKILVTESFEDLQWCAKNYPAFESYLSKITKSQIDSFEKIAHLEKLFNDRPFAAEGKLKQSIKVLGEWIASSARLKILRIKLLNDLSSMAFDGAREAENFFKDCAIDYIKKLDEFIDIRWILDTYRNEWSIWVLGELINTFLKSVDMEKNIDFWVLYQNDDKNEFVDIKKSEHEYVYGKTGLARDVVVTGDVHGDLHQIVLGLIKQGFCRATGKYFYYDTGYYDKQRKKWGRRIESNMDVKGILSEPVQLEQITIPGCVDNYLFNTEEHEKLYEKAHMEASKMAALKRPGNIIVLPELEIISSSANAVQVLLGDFLDRGKWDVECFYLAADLLDRAPKGLIKVVLANHELALMDPAYLKRPDYYKGRFRDNMANKLKELILNDKVKAVEVEQGVLYSHSFISTEFLSEFKQEVLHMGDGLRVINFFLDTTIKKDFDLYNKNLLILADMINKALKESIANNQDSCIFRNQGPFLARFPDETPCESIQSCFGHTANSDEPVRNIEGKTYKHFCIDFASSYAMRFDKKGDPMYVINRAGELFVVRLKEEIRDLVFVTVDGVADCSMFVDYTIISKSRVQSAA